jgi:hypothetical protein
MKYKTNYRDIIYAYLYAIYENNSYSDNKFNNKTKNELLRRYSAIDSFKKGKYVLNRDKYLLYYDKNTKNMYSLYAMFSNKTGNKNLKILNENMDTNILDKIIKDNIEDIFDNILENKSHPQKLLDLYNDLNNFPNLYSAKYWLLNKVAKAKIHYEINRFDKINNRKKKRNKQNIAFPKEITNIYTELQNIVNKVNNNTPLEEYEKDEYIFNKKGSELISLGEYEQAKNQKVQTAGNSLRAGMPILFGGGSSKKKKRQYSP